MHDINSVSIDDFVEFLSNLWRSSMEQFHVSNEQVRSQLWRFDHVAGYTGTRSGAILDGKVKTSPDDPDDFDTVYIKEVLLTYKHCNLTLFPSADGAKILLLYTKGGCKAGKKPSV